MPFIDPAFLLNEVQPVQRLLITSADDSDVIKTSFELAKAYQKKGEHILWVDGNLGEHTFEKIPQNPDLRKVILGQLPLTEILQQIEDITVFVSFEATAPL